MGSENQKEFEMGEKKKKGIWEGVGTGPVGFSFKGLLFREQSVML